MLQASFQSLKHLNKGGKENEFGLSGIAKGLALAAARYLQGARQKRVFHAIVDHDAATGKAVVEILVALVRVFPDAGSRFETDNTNTFDRTARIKIEEFVGHNGAFAASDSLRDIGHHFMNVLYHYTPASLKN